MNLIKPQFNIVYWSQISNVQFSIKNLINLAKEIFVFLKK